ncbi:MAG: YheU family protein [Pseudomonadales bacterium]|nr:YheU family protein [Pseudomonadales bacterium]
MVANLGQLNIPWQELSKDALDGVIQEFVTREGTEYGALEVSMADKCHQVRQQLERGEALITFDESTQSCSIVPVG